MKRYTPEVFNLEARMVESQYGDYYRVGSVVFTLTADQMDRAKKWIDGHDCDIAYSGPIGGTITYCFNITGIGIGQTVTCSCGKELDLTDYDLW